ncbi:MAG TPA: efflux RND transporter permease subunit, partial [Polyangiales bacterium]
TVEIENIHRNLAMGKPLTRAILDGAQQIAVPALVSTLCICIVFVPVVFITGAARSLFIPLALAVVFAMLMSYVLSRTLVPTAARLLLGPEAEAHQHGQVSSNFFARLVRGFDRGFERMRDGYGRTLQFALLHRAGFIALFALFVAGSVALFPLIGRDFFPSVDAGLIKLHVRGAAGTRIEETEREVAKVERAIREVIPPHEIAIMLDNMGMPPSGINLSLSEGALISPADAQISISLKPEHQPTADYVAKLRKLLPERFPDKTFFFLAPDISTQVLNFGLAAPIDVQVVGPVGQEDATLALARSIEREVAKIPGAADVHLAQVPRGPQLRVNVDRSMAAQNGLTQRDVASDLLVSLSSSGQVAPNYWLDKRGVQYLVAVQTPQFENGSLAALDQTPLSLAQSGGSPQLLSNVGAIERTTGPVNITHYNVARTFDVQANVAGTDLGSVASGVEQVLAKFQKNMPKGTKVTLQGQAASMASSFRGLSFGLCFAVLLVYLLLVVNFQS